jgi:hypothetical protein
MNNDEVQALILRLLDEALGKKPKATPRRSGIGRPRRYVCDNDRYKAYRLRKKARMAAQKGLTNRPGADAM